MQSEQQRGGIYPASKFRIAVTGKGGVGKTIVSALMSRLLADHGRKVLLVDADPAMGLAYILGGPTDRSIGDYRDRILTDPAVKRELNNARIKDTLVRESLLKLPQHDLLVMGKEESSECYCGVNNLLKYGIGAIAKDYDVMLVDCEAGLEQIQRRVLDAADTLLIIADMSGRSIKTAAKIKQMVAAGQAAGDFKRCGLILNRVKGESGRFRALAEGAGLEILGSLPEDEDVRRLDLEDLPISELPSTSPSLAALKVILGDMGLI